MMKDLSALQRLGLPAEFGAALLIFCLVLSVSPYLSNVDFGIFKIPELKLQSQRRLRFIGPLALIIAILLHIPFAIKGGDSPEAPVETPHAESPPASSSAVEAEPNISPPEITSTPDSKPTSVKLESRPQLTPIPSFYRVNLMISTSMKNATVWLNGVEAKVINRTAGLIVIEVPSNKGNSQIKLERADGVSCNVSVSINRDGQTLTPCEV